ncbi:D-alanyl-D-alanine carboxypeptidase [Alicyclobacillus cycloheptanicus]|uniref:D-alanyl-D-alanine carboxypeptidase (Penicillin-binding protein 5/6) n=1 Tax=Alicyclobacillus cycloheptanicus TaxID=1457 RepID=A0ABT9XDL8_9BACL|nr:D-alanyl-D-alanine carboxypeptidase [Alicyclobacillus cycloheptanicus]MDQ0188382.1 D-alanyl-D-alanine carboxypeptidase (penicillin-binding protein 5/6) [Alicyclobacillus cycloheptanicus]WDM01088.1 D-alanyl-D-alanine carboxypeptidase [Alicyclobacillus cycloheptanicus]
MKHIGRYLIPSAVVVFAIVQLVRPIPHPAASLSVPPTATVPGQLHLTLPAAGQTAVMASGIGIMAATPNEKPVPIASVTKLMTAYLVLKHHPLKAGENGPSVTITANDEATYEADAARGDSVLKVQAGETLTERQLLEGLLLPSADNIATTLADWVDGSEPAFIKEMNQTAKQLGMNHTTYTSASGVAATTVSTAVDQLKIAQADMAIPALRAIVKMPEATFPVAGTVYNVDYVLGQDGIVGVKTGSTFQAGGCFVSARYQTVGSRKVLLLGVMLGQQGTPSPLMQALTSSAALLQQAGTNLHLETLKADRGAYATFTTPWGETSTLSSKQVPTFIGFPGMKVRISLVPQTTPRLPVRAGSKVVQLQMNAGRQSAVYELTTDRSIRPPSVWWRLFRV